MTYLMVTGVLVVVCAALLLVARVPIMIALGFPALVGSLVLGGTTALKTAGLALIDPFNLYAFAGLVLWCSIAGILIESGLMERYLTALHTLFGRQVTQQRREAWNSGVHGLPLTVVSLVLVAGGSTHPDGHFLLLQMLLILLIVAIIGGVMMLISAAPLSSMTMKKMKSHDGEVWKETAKATAEVTEDGAAKRISSKSESVRILLLPLILTVVSILLVCLTPVDLTDLGAIVWIVCAVAGVIHGGTVWFADAGQQTALNVAFVGSTVAGAWWFADTLNLVNLVPQGTVTGGNMALWLFIGTLVLSMLLGEILGAEAGALLAVAVLSPLVAPTLDAGVAAEIASAILTSFLVGAAIIGGILARVLPPKSSPWPLTPTPVS